MVLYCENLPDTPEVNDRDTLCRPLAAFSFTDTSWVNRFYKGAMSTPGPLLKLLGCAADRQAVTPWFGTSLHYSYSSTYATGRF